MKNLAKFGMMPGLIQCKYKLIITVPLLDHYALLLFTLRLTALLELKL